MVEDTSDFTRYIKSVLHDNKPPSSNVYKKLTFGDSVETQGEMKRKIVERTPLATKKSKDETVLESPWEIRRAHNSLVIAKNEIAELQNYIEKQHNLRKEMETLFEIEKEALQRQKTNDTRTIAELEHRLSCLKKREQDLKTTSIRSSGNFDDLKLSMETKLDQKDKIITQLKEEIHDLKQTYDAKEKNVVQLQKNNTTQISNIEFKNQEYQRVITELRDENTALKKIQDKYLRMEAEFEAAKVQVHTLESELGNYKGYQTQMKALHKKLATIPELESELKQYRHEISTLRENVQNKLILEEQVYDLNSKLSSANNKLKEMTNVQVELARVDILLKEWQAVGRDFNKENNTPKDLKKYIEELQQNELILTADKLKSQSSLKTAEHELASAKQDLLKASTQITDLKTSLKQQQNFTHKVQKKLQLVAKERDSYRGLIDSYDQDLTIINPSNMSSAEILLKEKIVAMEKIIEGYKEQVESLEKELQPNSFQSSPAPPVLAEQLTRIQEENSKLSRENERLTKRCDECEQLIEKLHQSKNIATENEKILHYALNPSTISQNAHKEDMKSLQTEIERLKKKIKRLEQCATDVTQTQNITGTTELLMLREKTKADETKIERLKEICKSSIHEFRDVCYMMLGYKIDRSNTSYRITNMYAENENEYLSFECENGLIKLLETPYLGTLDDLVSTYLRQCDSIPAFLSALTLDLFKRTTIMETTNTLP